MGFWRAFGTGQASMTDPSQDTPPPPETGPPAAEEAPEAAGRARHRRGAPSRWTIKSGTIDNELRNAVALAARRAGMAQADWIADRLRRVATAELTGETLPALTAEQMVEQVEKTLHEVREHQQQATTQYEQTMQAVRLRQRLAEAEQEKRFDALARQLEQLTTLQRRSLWQRLFGRG
jgi:hypothetical protein